MRSILLVEDDENDVFFMRHAMERARITTPLQVARDGQSALEYLSGTGDFADRARFPLPGFVLLDLRLPRLPGLDVLQWIRGHRDHETMVVIVLTSSKDPRDIENAYRFGANAYLVKPADADQLAGMVEDLRDFWLKHNQAPPQRV